MDLGRDGDALPYFEEVIERFGTAPELELRHQVARAHVKRGCVFGDLERFADAEASFDAVITGVGDASEPELRVQVLLALYNKAFYLARAGRFVDALHTCSALLNPFTDVEPPKGTRAVMAEGILLAASVAFDMDDLEPAVRLYTELVSRFRDDDELEVQVTVTTALSSMATALGRLGRVETPERSRPMTTCSRISASRHSHRCESPRRGALQSRILAREDRSQRGRARRLPQGHRSLRRRRERRD